MPLHAFGEYTDMKTELYHTNIKSQWLKYRTSFSAQVTSINVCSKRLNSNKTA